MHSDLFKKFYRKMAIQGLFKSLLNSLLIALAAVTVTALVLWIVGAKITWIVYIVFGAILVVSTLLFYFLKYKPDDKMIARKLDETGLEERMITMLELKDDDSFIAKRQREDATKTLSSVKEDLLKFTCSVGLIVALAIIVNAAAGSVTVSYLHEAGKIDSLVKIVQEEILPEPEVYFDVTYDVKGEGVIHGAAFQTVLKGSDCTDVSAEADDGWAFMGWLIDGEEDILCNSIHRKDLAVKSNLNVIAVFEEIDETDPNAPEDLDVTENQNQNGDGSSEPGELPEDQNNSSQSNQNNMSNDSNQNSSSGNQGGGQYEESNQIIDGNTYYGGDVYDNARQDAVDKMKGNDSISDGDRGIASDYFDTIKN